MHCRLKSDCSYPEHCTTLLQHKGKKPKTNKKSGDVTQSTLAHLPCEFPPLFVPAPPMVALRAWCWAYVRAKWASGQMTLWSPTTSSMASRFFTPLFSSIQSVYCSTTASKPISLACGTLSLTPGRHTI